MVAQVQKLLFFPHLMGSGNLLLLCGRSWIMMAAWKPLEPGSLVVRVGVWPGQVGWQGIQV